MRGSPGVPLVLIPGTRGSDTVSLGGGDPERRENSQHQERPTPRPVPQCAAVPSLRGLVRFWAIFACESLLAMPERPSNLLLQQLGTRLEKEAETRDALIGRIKARRGMAVLRVPVNPTRRTRAWED